MSILDKFINRSLNDEQKSYKTPSSSQYLTQLQQVRRQIEDKACQNITFSEPLLLLDKVGVIYPQTITVVQGQKGVHKSRLTESFCAAFVAGNPQLSFIGFGITALKRFHVVYIDTERNLTEQFPYAIQRIKERSGLSKSSRPSNLEAISLISIERVNRYDAIAEYLEAVRQEHPYDYIIVVLDVVTDCVSSFNDPKESMKLIDHINATINNHNVSFICVIHENPNSFGEAKARGHLGTELINKASTVMSIGYEKTANGKHSDLITVKFLHTRNTKRPEPHYLRYSEEAKGLVVADGEFVSQQKSLKSEKAGLGELKDWLNENLNGRISKQGLLAELTAYFGCTGKTIETRLRELTEGDNPTLKRIKEGKEVYFERSVPL